MLTRRAQPAVVILGKGLFTTDVPASAVLSIHTNITTSIPTVVPSLSRSVIRARIIPANANPLTTTNTVLVETVSHTTVTVYHTLTRTVKHEITAERNAAATGKRGGEEM